MKYTTRLTTLFSLCAGFNGIPALLHGAQAAEIHLSHFSEFMSPAFTSSHANSAVPGPGGEEYAPSQILNNTWLGYQFQDHWSFIYWQNSQLNLNSLSDPGDLGSGMSFLLNDPRFEIRYDRQLNFSGWSLMTDLFLEPGMTEASRSAGKKTAVGIHQEFEAPISASRFTMGYVLETIFGFYGAEAEQAIDFCGVFQPWLKYSFNDWLSTQHWVSLPYRHQHGQSGSGWYWDAAGLPYVQNGVGADLSDKISVSVMLNQYLGAPMTLKNTWASLWLNWDAL